MSDIRKAAILLMSLPEDQAGQLMIKLTPKQIEQVSIEIAKLGRLTGEEQEKVILEFADVNPNSLGLAGGGLDVARGLVEKGLGNKAAPIIDIVRQSIERNVPLEELVSNDPRLGPECLTLLEPGSALRRRTSAGGGGPEPVARQLERARARLAQQRTWLEP